MTRCSLFIRQAHYLLKVNKIRQSIKRKDNEEMEIYALVSTLLIFNGIERENSINWQRLSEN